MIFRNFLVLGKPNSHSGLALLQEVGTFQDLPTNLIKEHPLSSLTGRQTLEKSFIFRIFFVCKFFLTGLLKYSQHLEVVKRQLPSILFTSKGHFIELIFFNSPPPLAIKILISKEAKLTSFENTTYLFNAKTF